MLLYAVVFGGTYSKLILQYSIYYSMLHFAILYCTIIYYAMLYYTTHCYAMLWCTTAQY